MPGSRTDNMQIFSLFSLFCCFVLASSSGNKRDRSTSPSGPRKRLRTVQEAPFLVEDVQVKIVWHILDSLPLDFEGDVMTFLQPYRLIDKSWKAAIDQVIPHLAKHPKVAFLKAKQLNWKITTPEEMELLKTCKNLLDIETLFKVIFLAQDESIFPLVQDAAAFAEFSPQNLIPTNPEVISISDDSSDSGEDSDESGDGSADAVVEIIDKVLREAIRMGALVSDLFPDAQFSSDESEMEDQFFSSLYYDVTANILDRGDIVAKMSVKELIFYLFLEDLVNPLNQGCITLAIMLHMVECFKNGDMARFEAVRSVLASVKLPHSGVHALFPVMNYAIVVAIACGKRDFINQLGIDYQALLQELQDKGINDIVLENAIMEIKLFVEDEDESRSALPDIITNNPLYDFVANALHYQEHDVLFGWTLAQDRG